MKLVIDCSALESLELEVFLARSRCNTAVLTNICANETFNRGQNAVALHKTLAGHRGQVLVLKYTGAIAMLRPRSKGLLHRLVDEEETAQFPKYAALLAAESGPLVERLPGKQKRAREYLDSLLPLGEEMRTEFKKLMPAGTALERFKGVDLFIPPRGKGEDMILAMVNERVVLIGGMIEIESTPGAGTTVFVRVPLEAGNPAEN